MIWCPSHRFHTPARLLADRHYNRQKPGSPQFMPPGSCRVLIADNQKAVFGLSYPKAEFVKHAWAGAWINSIFRNENAGPLASTMIREAIAIMRTLYDLPPQGCVTFVDPKKTRGVLRRGERIHVPNVTNGATSTLFRCCATKMADASSQRIEGSK
jgi:hypothetical protein